MSKQFFPYKIHSKESDNTPSWSDLLAYQKLSKYLKLLSNWAHKLTPIKFIQGRSFKRHARESNHSCTRHTLSWPDIHVYHKYHQNKSYWMHKLSPIKFIQGRYLKMPAKESNHSRTHHLDMIYMPTKYYQNIFCLQAFHLLQ